MPIVPRYDSIQTDIPVPEVPVQPIVTTLPETMKQVSQIAHEVEGGLMSLQARKQLAEDTAYIAQKSMAAQTWIDSTTDAIKKNSATRLNAEKEFETQLAPKLDEWTKDMRPDVAAETQKRLVPRIIAARRMMRATQDEYRIADWKATASTYADSQVDRAGRLDTPDDDVFSAVTERRSQSYVTAEPTTVVTRSEFGQGMDAAVNATLMKPEAAQKFEKDTLNAMAYRRLQRMIVSDDLGTVKQAIAILDKEEGQRGSTFARFLDPEKGHMIDLRRSANGQVEVIEQRSVRDANAAATLADKQKREREAEDKKRDNVEIADLGYGIFTGTHGMADVNQLRISNPTFMQNKDTQIEMLRLLDERGRIGGTTNWSLYNQFYSEIVRTRGAANVTDRLLAVTAVPNGIARDDAQKLMAFATQAGERSVFKDDFFQAGQKDIDRKFNAQAGIVDRDKLSRYTEASREYYDKAKILVEKGEREKIPQLSREIGDRWYQQAPGVTAVPSRELSRFPTQEGLVNDFVQRLGPDPMKWNPAERAEFNRQAGVLGRNLEDQQRQFEQNAAPTKPAKPAGRPQQPNLIPPKQ
jgi:hypothetical protein